MCRGEQCSCFPGWVGPDCATRYVPQYQYNTLKSRLYREDGCSFVFCQKLNLQFSAVPRDILQRARGVRLGSGLPPLQKANKHIFLHFFSMSKGKLFFMSANPQFLGLIPLSEIFKFLTCASPQIANPQFFMVFMQIRKLFRSVNCTNAFFLLGQ
jgi:hypothetical protein